MPLLPYDYLHLVNCPEVVTISDNYILETLIITVTMSSLPYNRFAHVREDADAQAARDGLRGRAGEGVQPEEGRRAGTHALHRQDGQDKEIFID